MTSMRDQAIQAFGDFTNLPDLAGLHQRGRDPATARFELQLADGRIVPLGNVDALFSRTKVSRILAVTVGHTIPRCKPSDWEDAVGALIAHATDTTETPDETLRDRVADWLDQYTRASLTDREGAAALRAPFTHENQIHISAEDFSRWLKRNYSEQIAPSDLRAALTDLGFTATRVDYTTAGQGKTRKRTTARYYTANQEILGKTQP